MSKEVLKLLHTRRSVAVKTGVLNAPGPSRAQMEDILRAAARVPDHGMVCPFYFIVIEGEARREVGEIAAKIYASANPDAAEQELQAEAERYTRAPSVVAVIHRARPSKKPRWEQFLTVGAACQNALLAAQAHGFKGQWLSEWAAYDDEFAKAIGLDNRDRIAGFLYLGTCDEPQEDRQRPDLSEIVTYWSDDWSDEVEKNTALIKKGDVYDRDKFDIPEYLK